MNSLAHLLMNLFKAQRCLESTSTFPQYHLFHPSINQHQVCLLEADQLRSTYLSTNMLNEENTQHRASSK